MAGNTMGQFISALRKANGLTQQELADRLNVSNKAVSRWERDESAPDISLIPALAELLGVTCDELLKGERILDAEPREKREAKVEKQLRSLINRTLSRFWTLIRIACTDAVIGLIWMLGISYGFFRPIIGFAVMLLFEAIAFGLAVVALDRAKEVQNEHELFEEAGENLTAKFSRQLGNSSFTAFFLIAAAVLLSLPLVLWINDYVNSVLAMSSYLKIALGVVAPVLVLGWIKLKEPCAALLSGGKRQAEPVGPSMQTVRTMSAIQLGLLLAGLLCSVLSTHLNWSPDRIEIGSTLAGAVGSLLGVGSLVCPIVYFIKCKALRKKLIMPGLRNILMIGPVGAVMGAYTLWWSGEDGIRYLTWDWNVIWGALSAALILFAVFALVEVLLKREK